MAKQGDPNHGPGSTFDYNPNEDQDKMSKTQPTLPHSIPIPPPPPPKIDPVPAKKLQFGWGSLVLLIALIWAAEALGTALPGPFDDMFYEAIAALFFGFIQYLRSILYKK